MTDTILLIGHRGAGKTTLGKLLAERLSRPFHDIDDVVTRQTGKTPDELIAENEERFRALEIETLAEVVHATENCVIAVGGGIREIPTGVSVIWIDREGWEEAALRRRTRLRPDLSKADELQWMKETREPRYEHHAHYRLQIERDCTEENALSRLSLIVDWLMESRTSEAHRKTWIVAESDSMLDRCFADAELFGLAGFEVRSDLVERVPTSGRWLASLRTKEANFFKWHEQAAAFDCDAAFVDHAMLDGLSPRTLIISHHPKDVDQEYFDEMLDAGKRIVERYPEWEPFVEFKFAPVVKSWIELRFAYELCRVSLQKGGRVSFFPQGKRWKWMRAFRLRSLNRWNYIRPGTNDNTTGPPSLGYFLPTAIGPAPAKYCGVIGDPVDHSMGDVWHRAASLRLDGGSLGYLKIHMPVDEADEALYLLMKMNLHGLSVTAPLKCEVIQSHFVTNPDGATCGNTLTFRGGGWSLTDTDHAGMRACLSALRESGIEPGSTLVFGKGGVSNAVVKALEEMGWTPIVHLSARDGFGEYATRTFRLVVNASGKSLVESAPASESWLDLHYRNVGNTRAGVHLTGALFYEAQAMAQRAEWGLPVEENTDAR